MERRCVRKVFGLLLVVLTLWTTGCATMRGVGEDLQSLGREVEKVFTP
jgi:predicted small secreted protein